MFLVRILYLNLQLRRNRAQIKATSRNLDLASRIKSQNENQKCFERLQQWVCYRRSSKALLSSGKKKSHDLPFGKFFV